MTGRPEGMSETDGSTASPCRHPGARRQLSSGVKHVLGEAVGPELPSRQRGLIGDRLAAPEVVGSSRRR